MRAGSLFSGIGGLDLGLERAGMHVVWQCENDDYASRVLRKHWPAVPNLGDITTVDWTTVEPVDLVCGGYPCQPFSQAAHNNNTATDLWPQMARAIHALRPRYVLVENVTAHLGRGFARVLADLDALGFDAEWTTLTACAFGAPHPRPRLFAVAYPHGSCQPMLTVDAEMAELSTTASHRRDRWLPTPDDVRTDARVPHRVDRLRCLGNAVVPQVAEWIGRRILEWPVTPSSGSPPTSRTSGGSGARASTSSG